MKYLLILLSFIINEPGQTQLPDYYVYLVTGDATLQKTGAKPVSIKQKDLVFKNDKITLKKGASLTLVDKEASFLVLNTAGTYDANNLGSKVNKKTNDGITAKYLNLLFHELLDPSQDFEKFKKSNVAGIAGGVSRGDDCGNRVFPLNGLKTSAASIVFRWHKTSPSSAYSFEIYDNELKEILKINVKDTFRAVNTHETMKNKTGTYTWRVISKDGICEDEMPVYFEILSPENEQKLADQLTSGIGNGNFEMQLQQIDKLEKNGFINIASSRYASLVKANQDNRTLTKSYVLFLLKYGFNEEAKSAWKP